jgi:hypothetical protein
MKVLDFANRLRTVNQLLKMIPHDANKQSVLSDADLKTIFFKAMPTAWQQEFELQGKTLDDDYCAAVNYFVTQQTIKDAQKDRNEGARKRKQDDRNGRHQQGRGTHKKCGNNKRFDSRKTENKKVFVDYKGPCPVHPNANHTWGECFNNPRNATNNGGAGRGGRNCNSGRGRGGV